MGNSDYVHLAGQALWLILLLSAPPLLASLLVGLLVSLLQALTQVQEQTLTFVPKIIATILALILCASWMLGRLYSFARELFDLIPSAGQNL
jgi:flagellar biosynthetic protein FliQ